jgi:predicted nuclease of restriction endonuclease-like (RecB) superfamily
MNEFSRPIYYELLRDIKNRVRSAQLTATLAANAVMLRMYWDIGQMIAVRQSDEGWGAKVIERLANDLKNELPEEKGFSIANLKRMVRFYQENPGIAQISAQAVRQLPEHAKSPLADTIGGAGDRTYNADIFFQIPWGHNVILMQQVKEPSIRRWYAFQAVQQGWSRSQLTTEIKSQSHSRQGSAVTNFPSTLSDVDSQLAVGILKDPYIFDFLTLEEPFHERELETGLLTHMQKFLIELGRGFAFVGRQHRLELSDREFFVDLLFYHLQLRCFVVIDLKKGEFKPEYAGKMNFYCSVVDDQLCHQSDAPTIGLILCQTKEKIIAEYALRDIHKPIGVADYELTRSLPEALTSSLPTIEAIEAELSRDLDEDV